MDKYLGKYRIQSNRMPGWDYSGMGQYFITMVVNYRHCVFGKIKNESMVLNEWGRLPVTNGMNHS
jgi:putative transposase